MFKHLKAVLVATNAASRIFEDYTKVVLLLNDLSHESGDMNLQRKCDRENQYAKEELLVAARE